jgi:hypothetical protein
MGTVISYPGYQEEAFNTEVPLKPRDPDGPTVSARLGASHMPGAVQIQVWSDGACVFDFEYSNDEPPEEEYRTLPNDASISVRLGRHTRKIIQIVYDDAESRVHSDGFEFDPQVAAMWCAELPSHAQFACRRNAEVIGDILHVMPVSVREDIREALTSDQSESVAT